MSARGRGGILIVSATGFGRYHAAEHGSGAALWTRVGARPGQREGAGSARTVLLPCRASADRCRLPGRGHPALERLSEPLRRVLARGRVAVLHRPGGLTNPSVIAGPGRSTGRCGVRTAGRFRLACRLIRRRGRPG